MTGSPREPIGFYLGIEVGGGTIYSSLAVGENNERDTFTHGPMLVGCLIGIEVGWSSFAWFLELENGVVFPRQSTYTLGVNTDFLVRL